MVVPAFNQFGGPSWRAGQRVTIPAYYSWHVKTVPDAEDFGSLANKLLPIQDDDPPLTGLGGSIPLGTGDPGDIDLILVVGLGEDAPADLFAAHRDAGRLAILEPGMPTNTVGGVEAP